MVKKNTAIFLLLLLAGVHFSAVANAYPQSSEDIIREIEYSVHKTISDFFKSLSQWFPDWSQKSTVCGFYAKDGEGTLRKVAIFIDPSNKLTTHQGFQIAETWISSENIALLDLKIQKAVDEESWPTHHVVLDEQRNSAIPAVCLKSQK